MRERKKTKETLNPSRSVALFDIDNTLITGFTYFPFVDMLVDQGILDQNVSDTIKNDLRKSRGLKSGYQQFAGDVITHYCQGLAGKSKHQIELAGRMFFAFLRPVMLCGFSRELVREMNKHARTIAISGSPVEVLHPLASYLHIAEIHGVEAEVSGGRYTGRVKTNMAIREEKGKRIASLAEAGFSAETSFAFGDSDSDIPILEAVTNSFAVNPNHALTEVAKRNGWEIVDSENILSKVKTRLAKLQI